MKKIFSKTTSVLLAIAMLIGMGIISPISSQVSSEECETEILEGYTPIYTPEEFNNIRNNLSGSYILMNNITFLYEDFQDGGTYYNDGIGWIPIGSNAQPFTGKLDGNNFTVSGIYTELTDKDYEPIGLYVGLFGSNDGEIKNLTVNNNLCANSKYDGTWYLINRPILGNLVGYNSGEIINCHNKSSASVETITRGGLVGSNSGKISCCTNQASVFARQQSGGIAVMNSGTIQECINVSGVCVLGRALIESYKLGYVGGISAENSGTISDCFNLGEISGRRSNAVDPQCAGIAKSSNTAIVKNCYSIGLVENTGSYDWQNNLISNNYENCYAWNIMGTDKTTGAHTVEELKYQSTYQGFDFVNIWQMSDDTDYPFPILKNVPLKINKRIIGIYFSKQPDRMIFEVGEELNMSGGEYTYFYSDGTTSTLVLPNYNTPTYWILNTYDLDYSFKSVKSFTQAGYYDVMLFIPWSGTESFAPIKLQCVDVKELTGITVTPPNKITYTVGEELDLNGMVVTVSYNTQQKEEITDYTLSDFDSGKTGKQTITVTYGEFTDTFEIEITSCVEHKYGELIPEVPAKCGVEGKKPYYECSVCHKLFNENKGETTEEKLVIPALTHIAEEGWHYDIDNHWKMCANDCGTVIDGTTAKHSFEWKTDKEATEDETGLKHEECIVCNYKRNENTEIPKLDHVHIGIAHHDAVAATCHSLGNVEYWTCSNDKCVGKYFGDANCTTEIITVIIPINSNNHVCGTYIKDQKEATCYVGGYTGDIYCAGCHTKLESGSVIEKNAHNPASVWSTDANYHWKECQTVGCGNIIDKAAHSGGKATCTTKAICEVCGEKYGEVDVLAHDYDTEWTIDIPATATTSGSKSHHCKRCEAKTDITEIPKIKSVTDIFTDVKPGAWYVEAVQYAIDNSLFKGMSATTFEPNTTMTRAMVVQVLYNLEGKPEITDRKTKFTDIKLGDWYQDAVIWAETNGVVDGKTPTSFAPNENITREQLAAILYRYASYKKYDLTATAELTSFPDENNVSGYAVSAVKWAVGTRLISGNKINGVNQLDARGNATRAQVAEVLRSFCKNVVK